jgi:hypothetical protein
MFKWLLQIIKENPSITPSVNLSKSEVALIDEVYLTTTYGNYTKKEIDSFINELKSLHDDEAVSIDIYSEYNNNKYTLGTIRSIWGNRERYNALPYPISIDLRKYSTQSYINICKTLKYLGKNRIRFEYCHNNLVSISVCDYISASYIDWFYKFNNFDDGTTFIKSIYNNFSQNTSESNRTISIQLGTYDETDLADKLSQIKLMKFAYINYHFNKIKDEIEQTINQFPDQYYLITINDGKKEESMYSLNQPAQDVTGSYRIDNVLFRDNYFILIPAVMYKINITQHTKTELTKKLIASCDSHEVINKLNIYFGIK